MTLTHEEKVGLYIVGLVNELAAEGKFRLPLGALRPGKDAQATYEALKASGFRPTEKETLAAMAAFMELAAEATN